MLHAPHSLLPPPAPAAPAPAPAGIPLVLVFRAVPTDGQQLGSGDSSALADTVSSIIKIGEPVNQIHYPAVIHPAVKLPAMLLQLSTVRHCWHTASHLEPSEPLP